MYLQITYRFNYKIRMDEEQIRLMLEDDLSVSEYEEDESDYEDSVSMHEENCDTEQENDSDCEQEIFPSSSRFFIGKDSKTKWTKESSSTAVRTRSKNIVTQLPGVKGEAKGLKDPGSIWNLFFSEEVIRLITNWTNQQIERISSQFSRSSDCTLTDEIEIRAFLGLLLFAGVRRNNRLNAKDLFRTDGSSPEIFRLTMNWTRFYFLLRCLRFDNKDSRSARILLDKLAPIRDLFDTITASFTKFYSPSQFVTIDEKLEAFRGRCNFRQYIPSKPNKYGIKIYALTDAKMFYTLKMEVYTGKQPEGPYSVDNSSMAVVLRLCDVIHNTGRNITCDNFFTSIPLIDKLEQEYKLTVIGTIRKNKRELPNQFVNIRNREEKSSLFGHRSNCTLVSYVPKKSKNVLLVSSMHDGAKIDEETGKPEIIMDYNATKGGVDMVDKMCETYNVARGTNRWPMVIFYSLMNVAGINSYIIYTQNNPSIKTNRRQFLEELSYDLINEHLRRRAVHMNLPRLIRLRIAEILKLDNYECATTAKKNTSGRCSYCSSKKNRKTRYNCTNCQKFFCLEHAIMMCSDCFCSKSD